MSQKSNKSFKEYSQRWRELAARVQSPILDKELINMFMGTLQVQYLEKMVGSIFSTFSDIVTSDERIKSHIKKGKLPNTTSASSKAKKPYSNFPEKKDGEDNAIMGYSKRNRDHRPLSVPYRQVTFIASNQYPK